MEGPDGVVKGSHHPADSVVGVSNGIPSILVSDEYENSVITGDSGDDSGDEWRLTMSKEQRKRRNKEEKEVRRKKK